MKITVSAKTSTAKGSFGALGVKVVSEFEGRKTWKAHDILSFETSAHNIEVLRRFFPSATVEDLRLGAEAAEALDLGERTALGPAGPFFRMEPRPFQLENWNRFKEKDVWAIFSEQGTGKTKVAWDIISHRALIGMVTGVLILSSPKGVHAQWIEEQMPKHLWESVPVDTYVWDDGRKLPHWLGRLTPGRLQVVSGNIDMLKGKGLAFLEVFANQHKGRLLIIVDESDSIRNQSSKRHENLCALAEVTPQRGIMTGTPIAKDLVDEWSQFYFLNPDIIGHKYKTSFKAQYCLMGGYLNQSVVGSKNLEQFKELTAPHIFRATKAELDLPPKIYDSVVFDMSAEQRRMIREIRERFFADIEDADDVVAVKTGAVALIRIQQISNGYAVDEFGELHWLKNNPRLDVTMNLRRQLSGKVIIWCRFKEDVKLLLRQFNSAVSIYGEDKQEDRQKSKLAFIRNPNVTELIATAAAAGKGIDGLQEVCENAIYYSNSFNSIDRWQSEDRTHRMGMMGTASYFDLIARASADRGILNNLQRKKDIAALVLDDIRELGKVRIEQPRDQLDAIKELMGMIE